MCRQNTRYSSKRIIVALIVLCMTLIVQSAAQLKNGFYIGKCRTNNVENVIKAIVSSAFSKDPTIVAALLRLHFHDCFVRGCDASILLDGRNTEKTAGPNGSVRGYEIIDACKTRLEQLCPGTVSCADIIVIATRVAVNLASGGKISYAVETGRRDGTISSAQEALNSLPGPTIPVSNAVSLFRSKNLSPADFVLLLGGGHSVGIIHCNLFLDRLYNYQNSGRADPTMNPKFVSSCKSRCPRSGSNNFVFADQTPRSELVVDKGFYDAIRQGKGVLQIDQRIASDPLTRNIVARLSMTGDFTNQFGGAMVRLGRVGVLTGSKGQIRRNCRRVN